MKGFLLNRKQIRIYRKEKITTGKLSLLNKPLQKLKKFFFGESYDNRNELQKKKQEDIKKGIKIIKCGRGES